MNTMNLLPSVSIQPNLELKTWPKQLLGSLPLVFALPGRWYGPVFSLSFLDVYGPTESQSVYLGLIGKTLWLDQKGPILLKTTSKTKNVFDDNQCFC
jgi:hypothetical protein